MEAFATYHTALVALAVWALMVMVLSGLSTFGRTPENRCACGAPKRDYADPVYRRHRAFQNALETSPSFTAALVAAMLTGAAPWAVNGLAVVFILSRVAMAFVHIRTENQPMRSACYGIGWLCIAILAVLAIFAVL